MATASHSPRPAYPTPGAPVSSAPQSQPSTSSVFMPMSDSVVAGAQGSANQRAAHDAQHLLCARNARQIHLGHEIAAAAIATAGHRHQATTVITLPGTQDGALPLADDLRATLADYASNPHIQFYRRRTGTNERVEIHKNQDDFSVIDLAKGILARREELVIAFARPVPAGKTKDGTPILTARQEIDRELLAGERLSIASRFLASSNQPTSGMSSFAIHLPTGADGRTTAPVVGVPERINDQARELLSRCACASNARPPAAITALLDIIRGPRGASTIEKIRVPDRLQAFQVFLTRRPVPHQLPAADALNRLWPSLIPNSSPIHPKEVTETLSLQDLPSAPGQTERLPNEEPVAPAATPAPVVASEPPAARAQGYDEIVVN